MYGNWNNLISYRWYVETKNAIFYLRCLHFSAQLSCARSWCCKKCNATFFNFHRFHVQCFLSVPFFFALNLICATKRKFQWNWLSHSHAKNKNELSKRRDGKKIHQKLKCVQFIAGLNSIVSWNTTNFFFFLRKSELLARQWLCDFIYFCSYAYLLGIPHSCTHRFATTIFIYKSK